MFGKVITKESMEHEATDPTEIRNAQIREACYRKGYSQAYEASIPRPRRTWMIAAMCEHGDRIQEWRERGWRRGEYAPPAM